MSISDKQSEQNYDLFYEKIKNNLINQGGFQKVTRVRIIDKLLDEEYINHSYHKNLLRTAIIKDKKDEKYDMLSSLLVSSSVLLFFLIVFVPEKETFTRVLFSIYILCIYLIAYMYKE
jgi:hypothetical protein